MVQTADGLPMPRRLLAVMALSAGTVLVTMDASIATVALPTIAQDLHVDSSSSVLLVVLYNLVLAMTLLPFAVLGDRVGLRRMFLAGLGVYIAAGAMCCLASSLPWLLAFRALQAVGTAAALSVAIAMVRLIYPASQLGRGLGLNTVAGVTGAALAPALGGFLISIASWRWVFLAGAPLALISLAFGRALPRSEIRKEPFDGVGAVLCALTFGLLILGLESAARTHMPALSASLIAVGVLSAFAFVRHELRQRTPVLPVDLLARPAIALSVSAAFMAVLGSTAVLLSLPFRLHALGFSPAAIGAVIVPYAITTAICAPASGMLSDRIQPAVLGTIGLTVAIVALLTLAFIPAHPDQIDIGWRMGLCGVGFGIFFSPNARLVVGAAPMQRAASASSLIGTTRMIGQAMGSTLMGALLSLGLGLGPSPALIGAALTTGAMVCSAARLFRPAGRGAQLEVEPPAT